MAVPDVSMAGTTLLVSLMASLRYLAPFAFLALVPLGAWLGGGWTILAAALMPLCLASLDRALGDEAGAAKKAEVPALRWLPRSYIILQLTVTAWAAAWILRPEAGLTEAIGLALSTGFTTGVFGMLAAHEMIHSRDHRERALGLTMLASVFYLHFRIAHIYGHHRRAATLDDPASARFGEGLYAFLMRSISGQFREAWQFETRRLRRSGRPAFGMQNRMIVYVAIEALFMLAVGLIGGRALIFLVTVAILAIVLLESFNYVAHYGLSRRMRRDGRPERHGPQHAWNSSRRMNNAALFNMGRHSDHHRLAARSFEMLEAVPGAAELPSGYAGAILIALFPPIWRRVMDPRAEAAMAQQLGG